MPNILDIFKQILSDIISAIQGKPDALEGDVGDMENFFVDAAKYAAANIKPELLKIVADCMAATEQGLANASGDDKWAFCLPNIIAACEKDGVEFVLADVNYASEAVIQQRNLRFAALTDAAPTPAPETAAQQAEPSEPSDAASTQPQTAPTGA